MKPRTAWMPLTLRTTPAMPLVVATTRNRNRKRMTVCGHFLLGMVRNQCYEFYKAIVINNLD